MTQPTTETPGETTAADPTLPVVLTPKAVQMIKTTREQEGLDPESGLRIAVRGGGCSGFEYALDFELEEREGDFVGYVDDLKVMIDSVSARYLDGTEIDYVFGAQGAGFKFNNPIAVGSCGCGSSFSI